MYYQEKIKEINQKLSQLSKSKKAIVWTCGMHTMKMLMHTDLALYADRLEFADKEKAGSSIMGKKIRRPEEINWNQTDTVIISTLRYQEVIKQTLVEQFKFEGNIIALYQDDVREFYDLYDNSRGITWGENFETWEDAEAFCHAEGYRNETILGVTIEETEKLMTNRCVPDYFMVSRILSLYLKYKSVIVIDFGGALGGEYFKNREFLDRLNVVYKWCVVDLKDTVEYGRNNLETERLCFFTDVNEVYGEYGMDHYVVYMRGSIQYLKDAYDVLNGFQVLAPEEIIFDRAPVAAQEHYVVQKVRNYLYEGDFIVRIFNEKALIDDYQAKGYMLEENVEEMEMRFSDYHAFYKRMVFRRKEEQDVF